MNSFWDTLDSLGGTVGGVLSSQYNAKAAADNKKVADALEKAKAAKGTTDWGKIALYGGLALAAIVGVVLLTRK